MTRRYLRAACLLRLTVLAGLLGCEAPATHPRPAPVRPRPPAAVSAAQAVAKAAWDRQARELAVPPPAAQLGYHRYVGTVDGRPVLAEFTLRMEANHYPDTLQHAALRGGFYYRASGEGNWLGEAAYFMPGQTLETWYSELVGQYYEKLSVLCADQPLGPRLTGWFRPAGARQTVPVRLRESYADGVRYELLEEKTEDTDNPRHYNGQDYFPSMTQVYVHLLGPDTLRPGLARLQCPRPAARRRARLARTRTEPYDYKELSVEVTLNEADLLACTYDWVSGNRGSRYGDDGERSVLYDLRTGRALPLARQLRSGSLRPLQRLLTRQARGDTSRNCTYWRRGRRWLPLPNLGFRFTTTGLDAVYSGHDFEDDTHFYVQSISWARLRPLLHPRSPLHRLLRVRGLERAGAAAGTGRLQPAQGQGQQQRVGGHQEAGSAQRAG